MHITINAIPIRPGGGLTVLCGLVQSLRASRPAWQITVLTGHDATHDSVESLGAADVVHRALAGDNSVQIFLWQYTQLGRLLRGLSADVLLAFNHYQHHVPCRQIVYHLNLRRFSRTYRSRRPSTWLQEGVRDQLAKRALRRADANVFESQFLRDSAEAKLGRQAHNASVVYIGLPDSVMGMARPDASVALNSRRLVAITSPEPHKDNPTLFRMLANLVRKEPRQDWQLDIIGGVDASAWMPMRRLSDDLGVAHRITWHGFRNQVDITRRLHGALCLVSTSQLESFAMVALEAMARGCPAIVADCAAMPESIGEAGLLAMPGQPREFADAVRRLTTESDLRTRLVTRGYEWIQGFHWLRCGIAFSELIEALPQDSRSRSTEFGNDVAVGVASAPRGNDAA